MPQTLQNLALARLWSLGSARIRRSKTSHLPDCGLWALRDCGRSCAGCGLGALARRSSQPLDSGRFRRSKTSHLPDCGLWALRDCGRSCAGCGLGALARQILFFYSGPKLPFKRLKPLKPLKRSDTCQWLRHTSGFWTLQTLHGCLRRSKTSHLLDCGLWALRESDAPKPRTCQTVGSGLFETVGGVAQAVGSGRWRAGAASLWILDASDAPKPRTCQTVGSGLCETVGGVAQAVGSGLWRAKSFFSSGPKLPFKRLKPLTPLKPLKRFDTGHGCAIRLDAGRFRRSMDASDAPKPRTC